jgi:predicted small metal-binding protein
MRTGRHGTGSRENHDLVREINALLEDEKYEHGIEEGDMNNFAEPTQGSLHFNCSDVLAKNCDWHVSGDSEQEIMLLVEQHSQEKHGLILDGETRNGVHKKAASRRPWCSRCRC